MQRQSFLDREYFERQSGFFERVIRVIAIAPSDEADIKIRVMSGRNIDIAVADEEASLGAI
jgi:hypothetical protein